MHDQFAALVPIKRVARGKSRLGELGDAARQRLVMAFALDTVTALLESRAIALVVAVTDDVEVAVACRALGATAIPDGGDDLNDTLVQAAAEVARREPALRIMAVVADLPGLDAATVDQMAGLLTEGPTGFVPDASGTGTTAYLATSYGDFSPQFGPGSAVAHSSSGAQELALPAESTARQDIDTPQDLEQARTRLGAHTRLALTQLDIGNDLR